MAGVSTSPEAEGEGVTDMGGSMDRTTATRLAAVVALTAGLGVAAAMPAQANGGNSHRTGPCSMDSSWELKANANRGGSHKIDVDFRVRSGESGQLWDWTLTDNGTTASKGSSTTEHGNGEFRERVQVKNQRGFDKIVLDATNTVTGETCHGHVLLNGSH